MPAAAVFDECICLFWPPGVALIGANAGMALEHLIDHRPCGFHGILARKQTSVPLHGVSEQALVWGVFAGLLFQQIELSLFSNKFLACELDAGGEPDFCVRRKPEAKIIALAWGCCRVREKILWRRL